MDQWWILVFIYSLKLQKPDHNKDTSAHVNALDSL